MKEPKKETSAVSLVISAVALTILIIAAIAVFFWTGGLFHAGPVLKLEPGPVSYALLIVFIVIATLIVYKAGLHKTPES